MAAAPSRPTLLAVYRVQSGMPYHSARSTSYGMSWSRPEVLGFGSVRPKLLVLPGTGGHVALSGGRPGLSLWLSTDRTATAWTALNLAAVHNGLVGALSQTATRGTSLCLFGCSWCP